MSNSNDPKPAKLQIGDITFEGMGALTEQPLKTDKHGTIIFSFSQLGITTEEDVQEKIPNDISGIFTGVRYLLSQETEDIQAEVIVHAKVANPHEKTLAVHFEFIKRYDGLI
jgi:hypothetical protein